VNTNELIKENNELKLKLNIYESAIEYYEECHSSCFKCLVRKCKRLLQTDIRNIWNHDSIKTI
jgi:hypothetical protein